MFRGDAMRLGRLANLLTVIGVVLALAGAATALAAARAPDPGTTAPAPVARSTVHSVTNAPEADGASGMAVEPAPRVSADPASTISETGIPRKAATPPDSPIASSFVKNGPAVAVAVLVTVNPSVPVEGPDLRIVTGGGARDAAGRNGAGPVFQQAGITSYDITLKPGSNLISLTLMPDDTAIEAVLTVPGREATDLARRVVQGWNLVGFTATTAGDAAGASAWSSSAIGTPATWGAIRSFSPPSAALGGEVVVTVTASGYGPFGGIMETLPAGFSYVSSSLPDDSVTVNGQEVTFSLFGETDFTYTVAAPSAKGSYSFSGVLTNSDRAEVPVGGAITIAVTAGDPLIARYDANGNGMIERSEVIAAINDYFFGEGDGVISRSDVIRLINLYLFAPSTPHNRPGAPTGLTAVGNGQTRIDLSWSAPPSDGGSAITGYRIEVPENGSTWIDLVANTRNPATSYSHTVLTAGSTRHYRVSAINSAGTGPASNIATGTTATTAGDAATDRAALVALYNATDGANWHNNGNWLSNAPMGEWHGVTTDSDGRVTHLDLPYNQLTGGIPEELGNLANLEYLDLSNNQLTGEIPSALADLSNLEALFLSGNQLTGCIPASLGDVAINYLVELGLSYCSGDQAPDLVASVTSVGDAGILYVGESFTINAEVYNQGTGPAASTTLRYYRSTDRTISTSDTLVDTDPVDPVLVSGTSLESISRTAPSRTGTYYYGVCVDPVAGESDTRNNCSDAYPVVVDEPGKPDLIVQSPSASDNNPDTGGPLILYATVQNVGDGRLESARLTYYLSDNDTISGTDSAIRTVDVLDIYASSSIQMVLYGQNAPQDGGTYYYGACVHSAVPSESNTRNNCSDAYPVVVDEPGKPDLIVQSPSASDNNPDTGGPLILYATVQNVGDGRLESARLTYYLSDNDTISGTDSAIRTVDVLDIYASSSIQMVLYGQNAPQDGGTYYYGACVHSAVPSESNTRNNCSDAYPVVVDEPGNPDLIVQSPSASDNNPDTGGPLILYATVQNVGDGRLESARLTYYLSDNDTISGTDSAIRTVDVLDIYASSSIQMVLYGQNAPQDGGTYYYGACVHSAVPSESNTRNNCSDAYPVVVDEPGNPDLFAFVTAAGDAAVMYVDEPSATISALVGNEGDGTSSSTRLRFYLSSDSSITPTDDTLVGEIIVRAIGAGSSRDYSISMTAPSSEGTYYYYVCVDSVPGESDTQDNCQENAHKVLVLKPVWYYSDAKCGRTFSLFPPGFNYWFEGTVHARTALSSVIVRGWVGGYPEGLSYIDDDGGDLGSMTAGEDKDFSVTGFLAFTYQTQCGIHIFLEY